MQQIKVIFKLLTELEKSENLGLLVLLVALVALLIILVLVTKRKDGAPTPSKGKKKTHITASITYTAEK